MVDVQEKRLRDLEDRHRKLAADARDPAMRAQLLSIAQAYGELAHRRQRELAAERKGSATA